MILLIPKICLTLSTLYPGNYGTIVMLRSRRILDIHLRMVVVLIAFANLISWTIRKTLLAVVK